MRNWRPFIKDALEGLAGLGVERVIGVPMAPQFSTLSVQKYVDAATAALPSGLRFDAVTSYHSHPLLLQAFAERVRAATTGREAAERRHPRDSSSRRTACRSASSRRATCTPPKWRPPLEELRSSPASPIRNCVSKRRTYARALDWP